MKIRSIAPCRGPFQNEEPIEFNPGINIIRGPNGIGKTLILEYASLLGHVSAMTLARPPRKPDVVVKVSLSPSDKAFLRDLPATAQGDPALERFDRALSTIGWSLASLKEAGIPEGEFTLTFFHDQRTSNDGLKEILAKENRIREEVHVHGDETHVRIVQALNLWSRPIVLEEREGGEANTWSITPRFVRSLESGSSALHAAPIFYVNTDMYEFGTGLDVRESPKHLKEKITPIMVDRLQLVSCDRLPPEGRNVSDAFEAAEEQYLLCEEALKVSWGAVFGKFHSYESGTVTCSIVKANDGGEDQKLFSWHFELGSEPSASFISSGENQAIFVLAMMHGLVSEGSCMLLDEPELHLTFRAGSLLMENILKRATKTHSQAIIVTHLPHLYRSVVYDQPDAWAKEADYKYESIRMIHVGRKGDAVPRIVYDVEAVDRASRFAHADVITLADGLHVEEVSVWPPGKEWRSWLKLFRRRPKAGEAAPRADDARPPGQDSHTK